MTARFAGWLALTLIPPGFLHGLRSQSSGAGAPAASVAEAGGETLQAGSLRLEVHVSRTATLFHVVDQLADWSPFCHDQYAAGMGALSEEERRLLARHRAIRARRSWGQGLEQAFYTPLELDGALLEAVAREWITQDEADTELEVLAAFAVRVERLMAAEREPLEAFRKRIEEGLADMAELAERLRVLFRSTPPPLPVYLIANPADSDFGGGFNGGRLTLEVPRAADAWPTFLHEVFHAFLATRQTDLENAVRSAQAPDTALSLDYQTLNEGLAHALSPGLLHAGPAGSDPLAERVRELERRGLGLDDYHGRVYRLALVLRPLVQEALDPDASADPEESRFERLLARAVGAWHLLAER